MSIDWNVVNNTGEAFDLVSAKVRSKIQQLEKHLGSFPEDAIHLQAILDMHSRSQTYSVALNLRVPSNVLHVKKTSKSLSEALDKAQAALLISVAKIKAQYRKDHFWRGKEDKIQESLVLAEMPLDEGASPTTFEHVVVQTLEDEYTRLIDFTWRQIREYELAGIIDKRTLDARDIVDRVAEEVLRHPKLKPVGIDYGGWCKSLAYRNVQRGVQQLLLDANQRIPVELEISIQSDPMVDDVPEPEEIARQLVKDQIEPEEELLMDVIPDPSTPLPDVEVANRDMVSTMRSLLREWPKMEREVMEMYFFEGFRTEDIAATLQCDLKTVKHLLKRVRAKFRSRLAEIVDTDAAPTPSRSSRMAFTANLAAIEESIASTRNTDS